MAGEIEKYLLNQLTDAIGEATSTTPHLLAKLLRPKLIKLFEELKKLLENRPSQSLATEESKPARREKLYDLSNVLTDWQMLSKQSSYTPEALNLVNNLRISLKRITQELKEGGDRGALDWPHSTQQIDGKTSLRWSSRHVDATKVHGLNDKAMYMERLLVQRETDDPFKAIGIVGMAGIGKTTLCQLIFNRPKVKQYFLPRIWVCTSKQANEDSDDSKKEEIVKRILMCLGVEEEIIKAADETHGLRGLLFALRLQLMGKRYLIVLDDAWMLDKFYEKLDDGLTLDVKWGEQLAYGLPKGCGGTVIVTGRDEEVVKKMVGEENLHVLPLSNPENCWLIFKSVVKDGPEFPQYLTDLKDEIVKKCAGLPLAARMMGQIASTTLLSTD